MQESASTSQGAMMAVLGMTIKEVEDEINLIPKEGVCEI